MAVAIVFGLIAVASGSRALLAWTVAVGGMAGAAIAWVRGVWRSFSIEAEFDPPRAFAGEPVTLRVRIRNDKRMPIPILRLGIWLPPGLMPADAPATAPAAAGPGQAAEPGQVPATATAGGMAYRGVWLPPELVPEDSPHAIRGFRRRMFLGPRSEATLDFPVRVERRGEYWLERLDLEAVDPFGLAPVREQRHPEAAVLVMPEPRIAIPSEVRRRLPFGSPVRASRMFEERERFAGVRPYEPGDPLNRIHWRLTGHAGGLQTKLFEPTRTAEVVLALDLAVGEPFWNAVYPEIAEDTIGWASFLARRAFDAGWRAGLVANTHFTRGRGPLRIPPSARGREATVFTALARMPNEPTADMGPVLREIGRRLRRDANVILISPRPGPRLRHEVALLRRRGASVVELSPLDAWTGGATA